MVPFREFLKNLENAVRDSEGVSMKLYKCRSDWEAEQEARRQEMLIDPPIIGQENLAEADIGTLERTLERMQESRVERPGSSVLCLTDLMLVAKQVNRAGFRCESVSLTLPERDFRSLSRELSFCAGQGHTTFFYNDMEILRGVDEVIVWLDIPVIHPDREALEAEILRCLGRDAVGKLPEGAGGNRVSPRAEPIGEIPVTPSPASGDDRDSNSLAHLSDEAKVIAAKEAIATYARKKQLPSAAHLALFGELDGKAAGNKRAQSIVDMIRMPGPDIDIDDIDRNDHSLSAEPLSRAIDQIWVRENGGPYADLVCSRAERLAEMVWRAEAATDG